jgi:hypothetical protein
LKTLTKISTKIPDKIKAGLILVLALYGGAKIFIGHRPFTSALWSLAIALALFLNLLLDKWGPQNPRSPVKTESYRLFA